jgi:hypothetical protein
MSMAEVHHDLLGLRKGTGAVLLLTYRGDW